MPRGVYKRTKLGKPAWNRGKSWEELFGKEKASLIRKKMKENHADFNGENNPFYNKHHSKTTRKRQSVVRLGTHPSEKARENMSISRRGEKNHRFGKCPKKETVKKIRLAHIEYIKKNYGIVFPNFNKQACEFFKAFDEKYNTKGNYAVYGGGEYYIESLGYWVDYFNPDLKLIMEYDERKHYNNKGNLKPKDVRRQIEIQALYSDFEFRRIKQGEKVIENMM